VVDVADQEPGNGAPGDPVERFALGAIQAPRISRREQRAVRELCEQDGEPLRRVADAAGEEHRLVLVASRLAGAERFLCDLPARGAVRCVGIFRGDDSVNGALEALLGDYGERLGAEERPVCRPVRLAELAADGETDGEEVSDDDRERAEREEAEAARGRAAAGLGLDSDVEGRLRAAG
jgi:hypothetical protein